MKFNARLAQNLLVMMLSGLLLTSCANQSPLEVTRMLFGYIEPPKAESVMDSLRREYNRCMAIDNNRDCVQLAYDQVRVKQGLDPKPIPEGYVVIVQEEMNKPFDDESTEEEQEP